MYVNIILTGKIYITSERRTITRESVLSTLETWGVTCFRHCILFVFWSVTPWRLIGGSQWAYRACVFSVMSCTHPVTHVYFFPYLQYALNFHWRHYNLTYVRPERPHLNSETIARTLAPTGSLEAKSWWLVIRRRRIIWIQWWHNSKHAASTNREQGSMYASWHCEQ
jgi:hypothetical protein